MKGRRKSITSLGRQILSPFKSVKVSAVIIALLIVLYFLGLIIPQKWMFTTRQHYVQWQEENIVNRVLDRIGFTEIYVSPVTLFLLALFFLNLCLVISGRVPLVLKRIYVRGEPPSFTLSGVKRAENASIVVLNRETDNVPKSVIRFFKVRRWHVFEGQKSNTFVAVKNRFSPVGFLLFHLSFILCLVGGLLIMYTRFSGYLVLAEGQRFDGNTQTYHKVVREPIVFRRFPPLELYLHTVKPTYENDVPTRLIVHLQVRDRNGMKTELLKVNEPIRRGAMSILVEDVGISPRFVVWGPSSQMIDSAFVNLNVLKGREDSFQFDSDKRFAFYIRFFPDYVVKDGKEMTKSIELKNPAMHLVILKKGKKIFEGTITPGEHASMEPFTISYEDIRYWARLMVVREYGRLPLIMGFLFASIGLVMRLVFYQKTVRFEAVPERENTLIYIDGKSEYFKLSFEDEMKHIIKKLDLYLNEGS